MSVISGFCSSGCALMGAVLLMVGGVPMQDADAFAQESVVVRRPAPAACRLSGRIVSGSTPLPGVAEVASRGDQVVAATSTDVDGAYDMTLPGGQTYRLSTDLMGFAAERRDLALDTATCDTSLDLELALASDTRRASPGEPPPASAPVEEISGARRTRDAPLARQGTRRMGRGGRRQRFEPLDVELEGILTGALDLIPEDTGDPATRLFLLPGFSTDGATDALTIRGE